MAGRTCFVAEGFVIIDKRAKKREYLGTPRPAGVYRIRNVVNNRVFIGATLNLDGIFNRYRMQLKAGLHFSPALQSDWNEFGEEAFVFEVIEEIAPRDGIDMKKELEALEDLWLEQESPFGDRGYNEPKKSREERLRMIASKRKN